MSILSVSVFFFISNMVNINKYNLHEQELYEVPDSIKQVVGFGDQQFKKYYPIHWEHSIRCLWAGKDQAKLGAGSTEEHFKYTLKGREKSQGWDSLTSSTP